MVSGIIADGAIDITVPEGHLHMYCAKDFVLGRPDTAEEPQNTPDNILLYTDGGMACRTVGTISMKPKGDFTIGDNNFGSDGTPDGIYMWATEDIVLNAERHVVMKPDSYFNVGDSNKSDGTPSYIHMFTKADIRLYPEGNVVIETDSHATPTVNGSGIAIADYMKKPYAHFRGLSSQTIANAGWTDIELDSFAIEGITLGQDDIEITLSEAGVYHITGQLAAYLDGTGVTLCAYIRQEIDSTWQTVFDTANRAEDDDEWINVAISCMLVIDEPNTKLKLQGVVGSVAVDTRFGDTFLSIHKI